MFGERRASAERGKAPTAADRGGRGELVREKHRGWEKRRRKDKEGLIGGERKEKAPWAMGGASKLPNSRFLKAIQCLTKALCVSMWVTTGILKTPFFNWPRPDMCFRALLCLCHWARRIWSKFVCALFVCTVVVHPLHLCHMQHFHFLCQCIFST